MKNLLLISIEDQNDWAEPFGGHPQAHTPNMMRLARRGTVFGQAYAAAPACSPARTAALFSKWPWETGIYTNRHEWHHHFEKGGHKSLIGRLRDAGMTTIGSGKIFHDTFIEGIDLADWDDFFLAHHVEHAPKSKACKAGGFWPRADFGIDDSGIPSFDDRNLDWMLQKIQPGMTNTAWAFGTFRPHLPFIVPKEFFDIFPDEVQNPPGLGMDEFDPHNISTQRDLRKGGKLFAKSVSKSGRVLNRFGEYNFFVKSYLAAIAYADSILGKLLDRMEECGLWDETLIVLWTDHGWQLGEKLCFRKFTLWERALHVPFIFSGADIPTARIEVPVSTVDMAPTILSLLGLPEEKDFSGQDLAPTIRSGKPPARDHAPSYWVAAVKGEEDTTGISIRSERYRYIEYWNGNRELYDHADDPWEYRNLALPKRSDEVTEGIMAELGAPLELIKRNARPAKPTGIDRETVDDD